MDPVPAGQLIAGILLFGLLYYFLNIMIGETVDLLGIGTNMWVILFNYIWTGVVAVALASYSIKFIKRMMEQKVQ